MRQILILLLLVPIVNALTITEVMYNPPGNDNNKEYIEVFSEEQIDLSEYQIEDLESNESLTLLQQFNSSFYLIVDEGFNTTEVNATIYSAGATIGNNLNNDGDAILLRKASRIQDIVIYSSSFGANSDGQALCRSGEIIRTILTPCTPTPGTQNEITNTTPTNTTTPANATPIYSFANLKINEVLPDPAGSDSAPLPQGEWVELYNTGETAVDAAGLKIKDKSENLVTISSSNVIETTVMQPRSYLVVYMNGNSLLNNNGFEQARLFNSQTLIDEMSYTDSMRSYSWSKIDDVFKITNTTPGTQNIFYEGQEEQDIQVTKQKTINAQPKESFLEIIDVKPKKAKLGDVIYVKISAYRGDTRKSAIQLELPQVADPLSMSLYTKYSNYSVQLPIQLKESCPKNASDLNYTIKLKGLDIEKGYSIELAAENCVTSVYNRLEGGINYSSPESFIKYKEAGTGEQVYESKDVLVEKYAMILFWASTILIIGYVVYERKTKG